MLPKKPLASHTRGMMISSPSFRRTSKGPATVGTASTRYPRSELKDSLEVVSLADRSEIKRHLKLENTYKMTPDKPFRSSEVERAAENILIQALEDQEYDPAQCKSVSQKLSADIMEAIKDLGYTRYKMVAVVSIGSMKERPGMQFGSRCLWNKETDNFVSVKYSNKSIFAVAMVYGLYYD